jgi:hypothetical protein
VLLRIRRRSTLRLKFRRPDWQING